MVPLIAEINPTVLFIAGLMLVVGVVLRWSRRKAKQQRKSAGGCLTQRCERREKHQQHPQRSPRKSWDAGKCRCTN